MARLTNRSYRSGTNPKLSLESLEGRRLMAADLGNASEVLASLDSPSECSQFLDSSDGEESNDATQNGIAQTVLQMTDIKDQRVAAREPGVDRIKLQDEIAPVAAREPGVDKAKIQSEVEELAARGAERQTEFVSSLMDSIDRGVRTCGDRAFGNDGNDTILDISVDQDAIDQDAID